MLTLKIAEDADPEGDGTPRRGPPRKWGGAYCWMTRAMLFGGRKIRGEHLRARHHHRPNSERLQYPYPGYGYGYAPITPTTPTPASPASRDTLALLPDTPSRRWPPPPRHGVRSHRPRLACAGGLVACPQAQLCAYYVRNR